jgi:hypothetical protein
VEDEEAGYDMEQLTAALKRARRLVAELERTREEAERSPREDLTPEQLTQGREAMEKTVVSARRMLAALEGAYEIALEETRDEGGHEEDDEEDGGQLVN